MKAILETGLANPGVALTSENEAEKQRLLDIWCGHGSMSEFDRLPDGNVRLCIGPELLCEKEAHN